MHRTETQGLVQLSSLTGPENDTGSPSVVAYADFSEQTGGYSGGSVRGHQHAPIAFP